MMNSLWQPTQRYGEQRRYVATGSGWWKMLAGVGAVMLLLALLMNPGSARPVHWDEPAAANTTAAAATAEEAPALESPAVETRSSAPAPAPTHTSLLDVIGKVSLVVLLIYGLSFGLNRARSQGWLPLPTIQPSAGETKRLVLTETLTLGRQQGTLYLLECDGRAMLVGSAADQLQLLWSAAPEPVTSLALVDDDTPRSGKTLAKAEPTVELPLFRQGFGQPARKESDWARERSRLISALVQAE